MELFWVLAWGPEAACVRDAQCAAWRGQALSSGFPTKKPLQKIPREKRQLALSIKHHVVCSLKKQTRESCVSVPLPWIYCRTWM